MPRPGAICLLFQLLEVLSYSKAVQWFRVQLHRRCLVSDLTPPHRVLVFWMIVQIILKVLHSFISYLLTPFKPGCTLRSLGRAPLSDPPSHWRPKRRLLVDVLCETTWAAEAREQEHTSLCRSVKPPTRETSQSSLLCWWVASQLANIQTSLNHQIL